jgi:hypothetical protein
MHDRWQARKLTDVRNSDSGTAFEAGIRPGHGAQWHTTDDQMGFRYIARAHTRRRDQLERWPWYYGRVLGSDRRGISLVTFRSQAVFA